MRELVDFQCLRGIDERAGERIAGQRTRLGAGGYDNVAGRQIETSAGRFGTSAL